MIFIAPLLEQGGNTPFVCALTARGQSLERVHAPDNPQLVMSKACTKPRVSDRSARASRPRCVHSGCGVVESSGNEPVKGQRREPTRPLGGTLPAAFRSAHP